VWVNIRDNGVGIEDIGRAMEPMYTSKPELERSGMGFSFMEAFMDELTVVSEKNRGTEVTMRKTIGEAADE
jgi:stage II sporulation protein AB (anti-sigma F factor)